MGDVVLAVEIGVVENLGEDILGEDVLDQHFLDFVLSHSWIDRLSGMIEELALGIGKVSARCALFGDDFA